MVINDLDPDVEDLVMQNLVEETPEPAHYIISPMKLNKMDTVVQILFEGGYADLAAACLCSLYCSPSCLRLSADASVCQSTMQDIHSTLKS